MQRGFIKLWRCIEDNDFYLSETFTKAQAWIDLVMIANHSDGLIFVRGVEVLVKRGFVGRSESTLAKRWGWSRDKVRRFKSMLETRQQIIQHNSFTLSQIEIVNYNLYQPNDTASKTADKTADQQQKNTNNKNKNNKKNNNISTKVDTTEVEPKEYGNQEINKILEAIKGKVGLEDFKESQLEQRRYGLHHLNLMKKITPSEYSRRLDIILDDSFKAKNAGSIKFLYREMKGFVESQSNTVVI